MCQNVFLAPTAKKGNLSVCNSRRLWRSRDCSPTENVLVFGRVQSRTNGRDEWTEQSLNSLLKQSPRLLYSKDENVGATKVKITVAATVLWFVRHSSGFTRRVSLVGSSFVGSPLVGHSSVTRFSYLRSFLRKNVESKVAYFDERNISSLYIFSEKWF